MPLLQIGTIPLAHRAARAAVLRRHAEQLHCSVPQLSDRKEATVNSNAAPSVQPLLQLRDPTPHS